MCSSIKRIEENVPRLRFPKYVDNLKRYTFKDFLYTLPFKSFLKEPEQNGTFEVIQQGNNPIVGFANGNPCEDYKDTVIFGDHTLSLYKPERPFFVATDGVRLIKGKDINGYYLLSLLEKYKPQNEGYKRYYKILSEQMCYISKNYAEQQKIGSFFQHIDYLIALQEQKLTLLNKYKRGVLREIYSNIKEYDYVSLKEISIICNGYAFNAKDYKKEGLYNIITITNVQGNKYIDNLNKCNRIRSIPDNINSYQILNENDILISMTGNVGRVSLNKGNNNLLNQRVCKIDNISKNVNKEYLFQILRNNKFEEFMTNLGKGANQKNISKSDIENYMIKLPDLNIQNKIANILSTYDILIDKEKQVLNRLQEMKSGLLQQMFI